MKFILVFGLNFCLKVLIVVVDFCVLWFIIIIFVFFVRRSWVVLKFVLLLVLVII